MTQNAFEKNKETQSFAEKKIRHFRPPKAAEIFFTRIFGKKIRIPKILPEKKTRKPQIGLEKK